MLYNQSFKNPGKMKVRENIKKIWDDCNTELFIRFLIHECNTEIKTRLDLLNFINRKREESSDDVLNESISILFNGLDPIYEKVTVRRLMDACFDKLDILNRKIITDKFIISQGIWLTDEEKVDLTEMDENGRIRDKRDVIVERLNLTPGVQLKFNPTGLTYTEFRSLVQLGFSQKISSLSTTTLKTLRDKILLLLDNNLNHHIKKWKMLAKNIERVAEARNIQLPTFEHEIS